MVSVDRKGLGGVRVVDVSSSATNPASATSAVIVALPEDPSVLTVESGDPADEIHCTLWFLGRIKEVKLDRDELRSTLSRVAASVGPCEARVTEVGSLGKMEPPATVLKLTRGLSVVRTLIDAVTPMPEQIWPMWTPHVTQGYGTEPTPDLVGTTIRFNRIALWWAGEKDEYKLHGN